MNGTLLDVTIFKTYNELFAGCSDIQTPKELDNTYCVYHQYTVKIPNRDNIHKMLQDSGIGAMFVLSGSITFTKSSCTSWMEKR